MFITVIQEHADRSEKRKIDNEQRIEIKSLRKKKWTKSMPKGIFV